MTSEQLNRTEGQGNTMTMTKAQFESTPEFKAYAKAYASWQAGEVTIAAVYYQEVILDNMVRKAMRKAMHKAK